MDTMRRCWSTRVIPRCLWRRRFETILAGHCFLYLKTIERAHLPKKMWEVIKLSSNYQEALNQITTHMKNIYKDHQINRCKQRLTRLRQTFLRMRRMQLTPQQVLVPVKQKTERREAAREKKAETAARLEMSIEHELLNRLKQVRNHGASSSGERCQIGSLR